VGDAPDRVRENRRRAAEALGVPEAKLYYLSQVHGTDAIVLRGDDEPEAVLERVGDITLSGSAGVACGVRTADCVPVLLADTTTGAVCAVHSGWRGTVAGAAAAGVGALRELIGAEGDLIAAIGPHIARCSFEVGEDVAEELARCSRAGELAVIRREGAKPHVDLERIVRAQLEDAGVRAERIERVPGCTVCDREDFHSFRRDGPRSGRLLSAIVAR
jgi:YfiH family protein